jgi:hypothetical protein
MPFGGPSLRVYFLQGWGLSNWKAETRKLLYLCGSREKHCGRNVESSAQLLDVGFIEGAFLVQDFGHDAFRAKDGNEIFLAEIIGIHQRAKDFHWAGVGNRPRDLPARG